MIDAMNYMAVRCNKNTKSESYSQSLCAAVLTENAVRCNKNTKSESYSQYTTGYASLRA